MKSIFTILSLAIISSMILTCNDDDNYPKIKEIYSQKIDSVRIPMDTMTLGVTQEILAYSTFTKVCEGFYDYDYQYTNDSTRTIANFAYKTNEACGSTTYLDGARINFKPLKVGTYNFKFFTGKDGSGTNTFLEKKIVVE